MYFLSMFNIPAIEEGKFHCFKYFKGYWIMNRPLGTVACICIFEEKKTQGAHLFISLPDFNDGQIILVSETNPKL